MRVICLNEKTYKKLIEKAGCYFCKNHSTEKTSTGEIPSGICADCCCSKTFMEHFEWKDSIHAVDLR